MKTPMVPVAVLAAVAALVFGLSRTGQADGARFKAKVFIDRTQPTSFVPVDDFRVNETISDEGGLRYLMVRGPEGVFQVPFSDIAEVQFIKLNGYMHGDVAMYESRVIGRTPELNRHGVIWLRVMLGVSSGHSWYLMPRTRADRGAGLLKIVFGDGMGTDVPLPPAEEPKLEVAPRVEAPAEPITLPAQPSVDDLNANNPLLDAFFEFDKSSLTGPATATLQRDGEWLKQNPTTKVVIEGYADPRGTNEYNLDLGERRAESTRQFLLNAGIAADRLGILARGKTTGFCPEPNEMCWAQDRRAHFVFVAR